MKKFPVSLLCGAAAMLITIVLYLTIFGNAFLRAMNILTLLGLLIAEAITTAYAYNAKGNPRKVGAAVVSALMIPAAAVLSVVYILFFPVGYSAYCGLYLVGMVLTNAIALILCFFNQGKEQEDQAFQNAKGQMLLLRKTVKCIMIDPAAEAYKEDLRAIEEKLHFTNDSIVVPADEKIRALLEELQANVANPEFDVPAALQALKKEIDARNIMTARNA